ncbi:MAG: hypothetical protein V9H69_24185 [Anaerolineae bacterium]
MRHKLNDDALVNLLCAIAQRWAKDAQRDPHELALLAQWLGMEPEDLRRLLATPQPERPRRPLGRPRAV